MPLAAVAAGAARRRGRVGDGRDDGGERPPSKKAADSRVVRVTPLAAQTP
jgi:hypothetical protein